MSMNNPAPSPYAKLGDAIREIAPTAVLARVYPKRRTVTHLFESDFHRMLTDLRTEEAVARLIRCSFGDAADWRRAHDFYLPTRTLYLAPEPHQSGYVPEDDHSFGLAFARRIAISDGNV